jgi:hypothetical protein
METSKKESLRRVVAREGKKTIPDNNEVLTHE